MIQSSPPEGRLAAGRPGGARTPSAGTPQNLGGEATGRVNTTPTLTLCMREVSDRPNIFHFTFYF